MTEELKPLPCPWCGEAPQLYVREINDGTYPPQNCVWTIRCENDDCEVLDGPVITGYTTERGAVKAWNTRSPAWRDIESAPRDGTEVDLWCRGQFGEGRSCDCWFFEGKWWQHSNGPDADEQSRIEIGSPVAWMPKPPLPLPPEETK